jgi:hypothetical protein
MNFFAERILTLLVSSTVKTKKASITIKRLREGGKKTRKISVTSRATEDFMCAIKRISSLMRSTTKTPLLGVLKIMLLRQNKIAT